MPIFVARQWIRHRTARINEISGRYSVLSNEFYLPELDDIAYQSETKKQARSDVPVSEELKQRARSLFEEDQRQVYTSYRELVDADIARELARINLPVSTYTEMYWQIDLHNLFHFIKLRAHPHAQKEIREYASTLFSITRRVAPAASESFENHILGGVRLSAREREAVVALYEGNPLPLSGKEKERFLEKIYSSTADPPVSS
jgi:thymidylate synthase (FAD)